MQQRKKQPVLTRRAILDAAGAEFSRHGYSGTGIGAIVASAGLTKGALFHHFPDKRALAAAWIGEDLREAHRGTWIEPLEAIGSLDGFRMFCRARCLEILPDDAASALVSLAAETATQDSVLGEVLGGVFEEWRQAIAALIERGVAGGWIYRSIQPAMEAAFLVSTFSGFTVIAKTSPDESMRRTCATALEGYLETLRPQ